MKKLSVNQIEYLLELIESYSKVSVRSTNLYLLLREMHAEEMRELEKMKDDLITASQSWKIRL